MLLNNQLDDDDDGLYIWKQILVRFLFHWIKYTEPLAGLVLLDLK